jgi:hypothetical protein
LHPTKPRFIIKKVAEDQMNTTASEIFMGLSILTLGALVLFVYYDLKKTMLGRATEKSGRRIRARPGKSPEEEQADSGRVE